MAKTRLILALLVALTTSFGSVMAAEDATRAQVSAATANAVGALKLEILSARITNSLTVAQFLDKTGSTDTLDETIQRAQQIGGPRWVDDQTCQIKLEIPGSRVAYVLVSIAAVRARLSPVPAAALEQQLADWKDRSFTATGISISATKVSGIRPLTAGEGWNGISDEARTQAVTAARLDAAQRVLDEIRPIELSSGQTVGELLRPEPVQRAVMDWLVSRPVTQVRFEDNLQVELTFSTPPDDLLETVIDTARTLRGTTLPTDQKTMDELRREFNKRVSAVVGRAGVTQRTIATRPATIILPAQPPAWTSVQLDAEGIAQRLATPLRTKTAAENQATENLRSRIAALPLTRTMTMDDAAKQDPRIADVINQSLLRARLYNVEYCADGSVRVRLMIEPRELWDSLRQATER